MNSEGKSVKPEKEGEDTVDSIIRQAFGKDHFRSFSRTGENHVQLIHLLNALDQQGNNKVSRSSKAENCIQEVENSLETSNVAGSVLSGMNGSKESNHFLKGNGIPVKGGKSMSEQMQCLKFPEAVVAFAQAAAKANGEPEKYLPGWPLLSPPKAQLQKCSKCTLEFCSSINYRRHIRVHRRPLNIVKDSLKTRKLLGAFWDKLSVDEAKEVVSFQNVSLEEVTGSSIVRALLSCVQKLGFASLPQTYVEAGVILLDVIQARPSRFPISSQKLLSALDDASEKTFLCCGTALSVQKYVFDGEIGKNALELKNIVACASFLLEQMLLKAWLADKDAEALRCQKLLVEEEEAAQKRQAVLLERKRLKKLRQKQQKAKELSDWEKVDFKVGLLDGAERSSDTIAIQSPRSPLESELNTSEALLDQDPPSLDHMGSRELDSAAILRQTFQFEDKKSEHEKLVPSQLAHPKQTRKSLNSHSRHGKSASLANGHKIWTPKSKAESEFRGTNERERPDDLVFDKRKVNIGSIGVALGDGDIQEELVRSDSRREEVKLWRPVSCSGNENSAEVNEVASVADWEKVDFKVGLLDGAECSSDTIAIQSPRSPLESELNTSEDHMGSREPDSAAILRQTFQFEDKKSEQEKLVPSQLMHPKQTRKSLNSHSRHGKSVSLANGHKIWTPLSKAESESRGTNEREQPDDLAFDKRKVIIGSISVALGDGDIQEKLVRLDSSREEVKSWRPVSCRGNENSVEVNEVASVAADQISSVTDCVGPGDVDDGGAGSCKNSVPVHASRDISEPRLFSREVMEALLAQRWRKTLASDHVKLVLSSENDQSDTHETPEGAPSTDHNTRVILGSTENQMVGLGLVEPSSAFISKPKFRPENTQKSYRLKYIPKKSSNRIPE